MSTPRMRPPARGELQRLQAHHAGAMQDRCYIGTVNPAADPLPCRWVSVPAEPVLLTAGVTPGVEFHLPAGTVVPDGASIWLVALHGAAVNPPVEYLPTGRPVAGPLAVTITARERRD